MEHALLRSAALAHQPRLELLPSLEDPAIAVRAFERELDVTVDALVSFEVGGGNSLVPIQAAALLDLPLIDGDGMGRALPEAQMMTFALAGIPYARPCAGLPRGDRAFSVA